ncbi:adenylate/guanylate cyclase domain-containing protein [Tateyamaria pelophila]|uniref:adenylate/guanylate cyclase domain-containing protein n=1 Tax=Tateyamaria pelophila TaxID=328415 RepID=UPI001CBA9473|nr:adenylate/guanylate cyclase domain-containing protein [Tateyamaria pelophila]
MPSPTQTKAVTNLFHNAEERAERLIAMLRLFISGSLALIILLLVLRLETDLDAQFQKQVGYAILVMASYFALGLLFLTIVRMGLFRPWMSWPSAMADCVFILISGWASIENLGMSGLHLMAFPTVWLIPVILACGALRFNPAIQATMAVVLILGVLITFLVPAGDPLRTAETMEVLYAFQPNLARIAMIALAAAVLVVASMRIRSLLLRSIREAEARGQLTRFLPAELDDQLNTHGLDEMRAGTQQRAAVMFVDIRGFTSMSEAMEPTQLSSFLGGFRACIARAADVSGGFVDKYIGDGAMLVFDNRDGTAGERAVQCARDILGNVHDWQSDVSIGIGVHIGDVFTGVVGDNGRLEYAVLGDTVNVAARLESATKDVKVPVLISNDVYDSAYQNANSWVRFDALKLRGRSGTITAWGLSVP